MEIEIVLDNMEINIDGVQYTLVKKEEPLKVGDWVRINKPKVNLTQVWRPGMDVHDGKVICVQHIGQHGNVRFDGWYYLPSWLTKVEKPKRWRAENGGEYYYLNRHLNISSTVNYRTIGDTNRYFIGNYFQTKEQAKEAAIIIKKALLDYQETLLDESK